MTTLAELVVEEPDETHGVAVDLDYGGGGFRAVLQIADPDAGSSVVWHDISDRISDIRWRFGSSSPRGNQDAGSSTIMLWAYDDSYAPWREDTSDLFGVNVPLNAGLLIRFGVFRVSGFGMQWWPQFTHVVRRWGDASAALGRVRYHKIEAVDLASTLANKPIGAQIEEGHLERISNLLATWPFGADVYGAETTDGSTPALTYPARDPQASTLQELRLAARNAGLVVRSQKNGRIIVHPAPRDTWNADVLAGVGATGTTWLNPIFVYYFGGPYFTYEPVAAGDIRFWPEMAGSSFGIESDWEHVANELTVSTPAGLYSFDDPVSASKFQDRSLPRETWLAENDQVVDDIVTERAYTQFVATPLRFGRELTGGFPALALLDHLDPLTIVYTTRVGREVVTVIGQVRSMDHEFKALGGTPSLRAVRWRAALQADIDERSTSAPLLPVEDLAADTVGADSASFSWTNPTQVVTPTQTQIRITSTGEWTEIAYPSTSITWLGLRAATSYTFEVRLIREVDGVVEAVSPVRSVTFMTDVDIDGDGDSVVVPDPGPCAVDLKLESSPDAITWTVEATYTDIYDDVVDGVWTPPDGIADDETLLYRWCYREVCDGVPGAWTCGGYGWGACLDPAALGGPTFADAVAFIPKVCGQEVREAISDTAGATGAAFGGFGFDADGNKALTSAAEGTVAYGTASQLDDVVNQSATIGIRVKLGESPVGIVKLFFAAGLELQAADNGAGWSLSGRVLRADGGSTTVTDTTVLSLDTWYDVRLTHDVETGDITLYVGGSTVETGTYVGARRAFLAGWSIALPDDSIASNAAVWAEISLPVGANLAAAILALNPLGYWKLNEASGTTAVDSSGNGRNGTFNAAVVDRINAPDGDSYVYLDAGVSSRPARVSIADATVFSNDNAPGLTVFAVVRPTETITGRRFIVSKANATPSPKSFEWALYANTTSSLWAIIWNSLGANRQLEYINSVMTVNDWQVVAFRTANNTQGARFDLYRDSATPLASTQDFISAGSYLNGTGQVVIGGWDADTGSPWRGAIAHVAIFAGSVDLSTLFAAAALDGWI